MAGSPPAENVILTSVPVEGADLPADTTAWLISAYWLISA